MPGAVTGHNEDEVESRIDQDLDDDTFEVDRILAQRTGADGKVRYLVRWKGYEDVSTSKLAM